MKWLHGFWLPVVIVNAIWTTHDNHIYRDDDIYHVKGINWFGIETNCMAPHGLWVHSLDYYLDFMRSHQYNAIRIPFSLESVYSLDQVLKYDCITQSPDIQGNTVRQLIHKIIGGAKFRNMTVLLDFHTVGGQITEYPSVYHVIDDNGYFLAWKTMLDEYGHYPNLLGIDIKNEPHGNIRWDTWGKFVTRFIDYVDQEAPYFNGLFFVEGIQEDSDGSAWGGSFSKLESRLGSKPNHRIVFSPHVYGISVRGSQAFDDNDARWNLWFGHLHETYTNSICIGEIGGWFQGADKYWHTQVLDYLLRANIQDAFYWCLNPNSIDTGGILDFDWTTPQMEKIQFSSMLQPSPSFPSFRT